MSVPAVPIRTAGPPDVALERGVPLAVRLYHAALVASWLAIAVPLAVWGWDYYMTPMAVRPEHAQDGLFRPTGLVGNRLGIAGTLMMAFGVVMYMTRKRWRRLHGWGKLRHWLSFHIWLCTLGPFLILLHTSLKLGGLVAIAFWSMATVVASGVVGRYVYVRIPRALNGRFLEMREIEASQREMRDALAAAGVPDETLDALAAPTSRLAVEVPTATMGVGRAFALALGAERAGRAAVRRLRGTPGVHDVRAAARLAQQYRRLALGRVVLAPFGRVFRYWHAVHLPLAIVMALILLIHITVAFLFGYAWTSAPPP